MENPIRQQEDNDHYFQVVDTAYRAESVRILLPEKSYLQELLDEPIPLQTRIAHLIPYVEPTAEVYNARAIANYIGATQNWVMSTARAIGLSDDTHKPSDAYPPLALALMEEEWAWAQSYEDLNDQLAPNAVSKFIARHVDWVEQTANELAVFPTLTQLGSGKIKRTYPKELIKQLRHIILVVPPADDWMTIGEIAAVTGKNKKTVKKIIESSMTEFEERRSHRGGHLARHYPLSAFDLVVRVIENARPPAGDWLTIRALSLRTGKSEKWVEDILRVRFAELSERRLDDAHVERTHYPPEVLDFLESLVEQYGERDGWMTVASISKLLGKEDDWVVKRINEQFLEERRTLFDSSGKTATHYPETVVNALRAELEVINSYPDAGSYLALSALAKVIGRSKLWVTNRIPYTGIEGEMRIDQSRRVFLYYPPEIVDKITSLPENVLSLKLPTQDQ